MRDEEGEGGELPAPWVAHRTAEGHLYYENLETNTTTWERPGHDDGVGAKSDRGSLYEGLQDVTGQQLLSLCSEADVTGWVERWSETESIPKGLKKAAKVRRGGWGGGGGWTLANADGLTLHQELKISRRVLSEWLARASADGGRGDDV